MKNKKGFTLVELLVVIALLAILAGIATPLILKVQQSIKSKMFDAKDKMIRSAAEMYARKNNISSDKYISLKELCDSGFIYIDKECSGNVNCCQKNPVNSESMGLCNIKIAYESTKKRYKAELTGKICQDESTCSAADNESNNCKNIE